MLDRNRTAIAELLARTFPASAEQLDESTVDAFVDALMAVKARRGAERSTPRASAGTGEHAVYRLRATHARRQPIVSVFTGETEAVRVTLGQHEPLEWDTSIGLVAPSDHLLPTVDAVRERFGDQIDGAFEHVEVITPARYAFARFAPMAIYLGYAKAGDPRPFFYVMEAGTATGQPKVLYLAPTLDATIEQLSGYTPTPLSKADHWYTGGLKFSDDGNDPTALYMRAARDRGGEPHLRLHVEYTRLDAEPTVIPAEDMVEAAMRMLAVQRGMTLDQNLVERLIAEAGMNLLGWVDKPDPVDTEQERERVANTLDATQWTAALDAFASGLSALERELLHASIPVLLDRVVQANGKFDRLERIEVDWLMNFEVPAQLGEPFRFSPAAERAYEVLIGRDPLPREDESIAEAGLDLLGQIVERMPSGLREHYRRFVRSVCRSAAESSGERSGFGRWLGEQVSEPEREALERISAALGLTN